ncbi:MAG: DEAD/DEAH box helicase [Deltaproteobacteria bacterium]|nr:DEAD/DEAH box helicase [Deltaproteobacteria bacterium]
MSTFAELGLSPELLRAVRDAEYHTPTPIQEHAIPAVLQGSDVLACAQTGTGKTAGFLLPILQQLAQGQLFSPQLRALVLSPTRELASQTGDNARAYSKYLRLRSTTVFGGVRLGPQIERLRTGVDLLIATPGRLMDLVERGTVKFNKLEVLVLDEADHMLDLGFLPTVRQLLHMLPTSRQTLMFSATMPPEIERLTREMLQSPVIINVGRRATPVEAVRQVLYAVEGEKKRDLLCHLLQHGHMRQVLVFTRTKVRADRLTRHLAQKGRRVATLHGGKSQNARTQALSGFRNGKVEVLVATDIAARGLDVDGISHVVNFDVPPTVEEYVHRIGRTARATATGDAISLVSADEVPFIRTIERGIGSPIPHQIVKGFAPAVDHLQAPARPPLSHAARIANGSIRHFAPRRRAQRSL